MLICGILDYTPITTIVMCIDIDTLDILLEMTLRT